MKNLYSAIAAFLLLTAFSASAQVQNIKSLFIPMTPDKEVPSGSYGQTDNDSFICYGTVEKISASTVFTNVEYNCKGVKSSIESHVKDKVGGTYIGSTFLYKSPILVMSRGGYTVGGLKPGISGVIVYYY